MSLSILVLGAPFSTQSSYSAYRYVNAALESGYTIERIFFYQEAIHAGSALATPPQDEFDLYSAWQDLIQNHSLECIVCIAAAARRGMINAGEAERHNKPANNLSECFQLSGLGQLVESMALSKRTITFGA